MTNGGLTVSRSETAESRVLLLCGYSVRLTLTGCAALGAGAGFWPSAADRTATGRGGTGLRKVATYLTSCWAMSER